MFSYLGYVKKEDLEKALKKCDKLEGDLKAASEKLSLAEKESMGIKSKNSELSQTIAKLEKDLADAKTEKEKLDKSVKDGQDKVKVLESKVTVLEKEKTKLEKDLAKAKEE